LSVDYIESIKQHMNKFSNAASNRTIKSKWKNSFGKRENIPVRHRILTLKESYNRYPYKNEISFSSYYYYMENTFKKPQRLSDLCEYCELARKLSFEIKKEARNTGYCESSNVEDYKSILIHFEKSKNQ
jgi:hypothetical protein